jgi:hypothetical protein
MALSSALLGRYKLDCSYCLMGTRRSSRCLCYGQRANLLLRADCPSHVTELSPENRVRNDELRK